MSNGVKFVLDVVVTWFVWKLLDQVFSGSR
jgi:hypothetical protein